MPLESRMEKRLSQRPHDCETEIAVYEHGTHFVFPEGVMKTMLPVGLGLFMPVSYTHLTLPTT